MAALQLLKLIDTSLCDILATWQGISNNQTSKYGWYPLFQLPYNLFYVATPFPASMQLVLCNYHRKSFRQKLPSFSACETCGAPTNIGDNWKDIINNLAIVNKILDLWWELPFFKTSPGLSLKMEIFIRHSARIYQF